MAIRRTRVDSNIVGPAHASEMEHNLVSGAKKTISGLGYLTFLQTAGTALPLTRGVWISAFNSSTSVGYLAVGNSAVGVPSAPGAGSFPIPPNSWATFCIGDNTHIRPGANVSAYLLEDYSALTNQ